ncbi:hypothetical protein [Streptomyces sp. NP-1717]|uniref:hypothetical protein n=1 Tax=Streptomyces sp. NP-1717 TaxID=2704470 RepID=UPI001F5DAE5A|nr:hypothetical protein [Streptomyces sp. NP-1717]MCI3226397.1 hypothetical protein [Streptomyces sp. NP-1717]
MHQPAASPCPDTEIRYRYEHITYRSLTAAGSEIDIIERHRARTPAEAIRQIRLSVRALVATLPPEERERALSSAEGGGCVGAVAAPHRGEPCGFSLSRHRARLEWTVHPYYAFHTPQTRRLPLLPR